MLEFYYDCLKRYLDWDDFQLSQIDTDSFYYAICKEGYDKLEKVKKETDCWFPCDKSTPERNPEMLVKIENTNVKYSKIYIRKLYTRII